MILNFVTQWETHKKHLKRCIIKNEPETYEQLLRLLVTEVLAKDYDLNLERKDIEEIYYCPDADRITVIDYGHYSGTVVFIIAQTGYQPETYWVLKMGYGSCGLCDTLKKLQDTPNMKERIAGYMTLALHMIQGLKEC